jgi:hypothetical protein
VLEEKRRLIDRATPIGALTTTRLFSLSSLALWAVAIVAGRLMAYL